MNTKCLVTPVLFGLCAMWGCSQLVELPVAHEAAPEEKLKAEENANLSVAPEPHALSEAKPLPPAVQPWTDRRSNKPWSELIVGKWVYAGRDIQGQKVWEFTKDGKLNRRYCYPAAPGRPAGVEGGSQDYHVNGNVLFPTSTFDDGIRVTESTTFIKSLTENELVIYSVSRTRWSMKVAKNEADRRKVPLEQVLAEVVREEQSKGSVYVRLKDK